ncbi:hypothetical protein QEN19_002534 [Hanseniaspora menglaensis]
MISLAESIEDIQLSVFHYNALATFIKTQILQPKVKLRNDSEEFQNQITKVIQYIDKIIFILNKQESEDDDPDDEESLNNSSNMAFVKIKYLNLYYYKHILSVKRQAVVTTTDPTELMKLENIKNQYRLKFLNESNLIGLNFLNKLSAKKILNGKNTQQLISLQKVLEIDNATNVNYDNIVDLWNKLFPNDRESRMANHKFKKMIETQIADFESNLKKKIPELFDDETDPDDFDDLLNKLDDEIKLQYHMLLILDLQKNSAQCISNIDSNLQEIQLLQKFITSTSVNDFHREKSLVINNYEKGDKLDTQTITPYNIERVYGKNYSNINFNLKNDQVETLKKKVKGFGQYAPTQTIDDLLEEEIAQGRIITQAGEKLSYDDIKDGNFLNNKKKRMNDAADNIRLTEEELNEDNYDYNDAKIYEARDWDKFKESVTKGSGNMGRRRG